MFPNKQNGDFKFNQTYVSMDQLFIYFLLLIAH